MERGKLPEISPPAWPQPATARLTNHPLPNRGFLELPFSWSGEIINRYRGYVNKTNGDGVMALFGVPFENASHACDAILSALNLQRDLRRQFPL